MTVIGQTLYLCGRVLRNLSRQPIWIARENLRQDLDCNVALQLCVASAIDLAHSAGAYGGSDFVRTQPRARIERHGRESTTV